MRFSLFARDSRDLREKRDESETSSSRIAPVAHVLQISLTILQARRRPDQMVRSPCFELPARRYRLVLFVFVTICVLVTVLPMALMFTILPMFPALAPLAMHFFHLAMLLFISLDL
jgi:hypothetical protein